MVRAKIRKPVDKSIATKGFEKFLFYLVQFTWGLPVNAISGIIYLILRKKYRTEKFRNAYITYIPGDWGGLSLGLFIFIAEGKAEGWTNNTKIHEYGHTIQSLILGPLYLLIIGIPSLTWASLPKLCDMRKEKQISYYSFYTEKWADRVAIRTTDFKFDK